MSLLLLLRGPGIQLGTPTRTDQIVAGVARRELTPPSGATVPAPVQPPSGSVR